MHAIAMVKKQQQHLAVGGGLISSLFSSSNISKQQDITTGAVLPCHYPSMPSSSASYSAWPWRWTSCGGLHPRTLSFRQQQPPLLPEENNGHGRQHHHHDSDIIDSHNVRMEKPHEAAYYYSTVNDLSTVDGDSSVVNSLSEDESEAMVILQALRSDRLLYDDEPADENEIVLKQPPPKPNKNKKSSLPLVVNNKDGDKQQQDTCSILAEFGGATAMSVESQNPYRDFRESMEAMVMSQLQGAGVVKQDWRWLEDMLGWYLRANSKSTHGIIVGAFVDLLLALTTNEDTSAHDSSSSSSSSSSPAATPAAANCSASSTDDGEDCSCCSSAS